MQKLLSRLTLVATAAGLGISAAQPVYAQTTNFADAKRLIEQKARVGSQLALTAKTLADEQFIDGDRQAARISYELAAGAVHQALADPGLMPESKANLDLLQRDIEYRIALIDTGLPFWGLEFTASADNPILRMKALMEGSAKLKALNKDIQELEARLKTMQFAQLMQMRDQSRQEAQVHIDQLEQEQGEIKTEFHEKARTDAYARISRLQMRQEDLGQVQREAESEIKSLEQQNQQLALDGLSQAAGIPASVTNAMATGDVNAALKQAALSYAGSSEFSELMKKAEGVAPGMAKLYEQARTLAERAENDIELARKIATTVREPSLANLSALGGRLLENMPQKQRAELEKVVLDAKPVGLLLSTAKKEAAVLEALGNQLRASGDTTVREAVSLLAKEHEDLRKWYGNVLGDLAKVTSPSLSASNALVDRILRDWAKDFVAAMPPEAASALQAQLKVTTRDELAGMLAQRGAGAIPAFTLFGGKLDIPSLSISIDLAATLESMSSTGLPPLDTAALQERFTGLLASGHDHAMKAALGGSSLFGLEAVTAVLAKGRSSNEVFDAVYSSIEYQAKARVGTAIAELEAGTQLARTQVQGAGMGDASSVTVAGANKPTNDQLDSVKKLVAGPLATVFPGVAVAVKVAEFFGNTFEMARLSGKIQKASDEINRLVEEEMHLRRLIEQSQTQEELAKLDTNIAKLHRRQTASDLRHLQAASDALLETEDELRKKIAGYRMNHFFFVAEELRAQYARLSRSLSLWSGATPGPRDYLQQQLRNDPRHLRLAVDPYVRALDIFDRDLPRQRQDIDQLASYWDYLVTQLESFCTNTTIGCAPDTPKIGVISSTEAISLRIALAGDWLKFVEWQRSQPTEPFRFALLVRPGLHQIDLNAYKLGTRVVHVMLTRNRPGGTADERASTISVTHPGFSFIPTPSGFVPEVLAPETREGLDPITNIEDNQHYESRWSNDLSRRGFEGHGLFTVWTVQVEPMPVNLDVTDLKMRFVYQYVPTSVYPIPAASLNPKAVEILAAETGHPVKVRLNGLTMLGDRVALERFVGAWQKGQGSAAKVKWKHGELTTVNPTSVTYDSSLVKAAAALTGSN